MYPTNVVKSVEKCNFGEYAEGKKIFSKKSSKKFGVTKKVVTFAARFGRSG